MKFVNSFKEMASGVVRVSVYVYTDTRSTNKKKGVKFPQFEIKLLSPIEKDQVKTINTDKHDWRMFTCNEVQIDTSLFKRDTFSKVSLKDVLSEVRSNVFKLRNIFNGERKWMVHSTDELGVKQYWCRSAWLTMIQPCSVISPDRFIKGNLFDVIRQLEREKQKFIEESNEDLSNLTFSLVEVSLHANKTETIEGFEVTYNDSVPL